jgi:hypothetical protein
LDGQQTFPPSESRSWCNEVEGDRSQRAARAVDDSPAGSRRGRGLGPQSAELLGRESLAAGENSSPVGKMAERAAALWLKRDELWKRRERRRREAGKWATIGATFCRVCVKQSHERRDYLLMRYMKRLTLTQSGKLSWSFARATGATSEIH